MTRTSGSMSELNRTLLRSTLAWSAETAGKWFTKARSASPATAPAFKVFETNVRRLMESDMSILLKRAAPSCGQEKAAEENRWRVVPGAFLLSSCGSGRRLRERAIHVPGSSMARIGDVLLMPAVNQEAHRTKQKVRHERHEINAVVVGARFLKRVVAL